MLVSKQRLNSNMLNEMARVNVGETNIFPYQTYEIAVFSRDHEPPHFHIKCDGWNIKFLIEDSSKYEIVKEGQKDSIKKYILKHIEEWLNSSSASVSSITNREMTKVLWAAVHSNMLND